MVALVCDESTRAQVLPVAISGLFVIATEVLADWGYDRNVIWRFSYYGLSSDRPCTYFSTDLDTPPRDDLGSGVENRLKTS